MGFLELIPKRVLFGSSLVFAASTISLIVYVVIPIHTNNAVEDNEEADGFHPLPEPLGNENFESSMGIYRKWAVAIDTQVCSKIAGDVFKRNGTAVDAAIAGLFCSGVVHPNSMGLGGGFIMNIYIKSQRKVYNLMARERAPKKAFPLMFVNNSMAADKGPLSVAVPGELLGYEEAKRRFGNPSISWASLIEPSIELCENGIPVSNYFGTLASLKRVRDRYEQDPTLRRVFTNPTTNELHKPGKTYKNILLAQTLRRIAINGANEIYGGGQTGKNMIQDLKELGGILEDDDLTDYRVNWDTPLEIKLPNNLTVVSSPPPSSGVILLNVLGTLAHLDLNPDQSADPITFQLFVEALKYAFAKRTRLGDWNMPRAKKDLQALVSEFISPIQMRLQSQELKRDSTSSDPAYYGADFSGEVIQDGGTSHSSYLAPNGDAVSVTSTINYHFGSGIMSKETGIILNNQMDDFSTPGFRNVYGIYPSKANYINPGARPVSSMVPTIILDPAGTVRFVVGGSGGPKIISATAMVCMLHLWLGQNIESSIKARRLHHQLLPMKVIHDRHFSQEALDYLTSVGHKIEVLPKSSRFAVIQGISQDQGIITASYDARKSGSVAGE